MSIDAHVVFSIDPIIVCFHLTKEMITDEKYFDRLFARWYEDQKTIPEDRPADRSSLPESNRRPALT